MMDAESTAPAAAVPRSKLAAAHPAHAAAASTHPSSLGETEATDEYHSADSIASFSSRSLVPRGPVTTPGGLLVDRGSLVRVLAQTLQSLGYASSAAALERESGVELESRDIAILRSAVLRGEWDAARARAKHLFAPAAARQVDRVLAEQKYLALVEQAIQSKSLSSSAHTNGHAPAAAAAESKEKEPNGATTNGASGSQVPLMRAVQFLQTELVPLYAPQKASRAPPAADPHLLHLASLFTCTSAESLRAQYRGTGVLPPASGASQAADTSSVYLPIFQRLAAHLPTNSFLQQEHHLLRLLEHSIQAQVQQCHFHHTDEAHTFHLNQRHQCSLSVDCQLANHEDEVLAVSFSHGSEPLRLATCSKDRTIRVYTMRAREDHLPAKADAMDDQRHTNGNAPAPARRTSNGAAHATNGAASSSSAAAVASSTPPASRKPSSSAASPFEFVCTGVLHPALNSRCSTPPSPSSSVSGSSHEQSSLGSLASPNAAYFSVLWSADDAHLLACNGAEASVFRVADGLVVMSAGARAVDNPAARIPAPAGIEEESDSETPPPAAVAASSSLRSPFASAQIPAPAFSSHRGALSLGLVSHILASPLIASVTHRSMLESGLAGLLASQQTSSRTSSLGHEDVVGHTEPLSCCAWIDESSFVTGSVDRRLILWSITGDILDVWSGDMITDLAVAADRLVAITPHNRCIIFQVKHGRIEEITSFAATGNIAAISLSPDARFALLSCIRPAELHLWELGPTDEQAAASASAAQLTWPDAASGPIPSAAESTPPPLPLTPALPSPISSPTLVRRYAGHHASRYIVRSCFGGPSSQLVLSGSEDGLLYAWHRGTGKLLAALRGHAATVNAVAATQVNGRFLLASAADDHTVLLWQLDTQPHAQESSC